MGVRGFQCLIFLTVMGLFFCSGEKFLIWVCSVPVFCHWKLCCVSCGFWNFHLLRSKPRWQPLEFGWLVFWILCLLRVDAWSGVKLMVICMYFHWNLFFPCGLCGCLDCRAVKNLGQCSFI